MSTLDALLTPEGLMALAVAVLAAVMGLRFSLPQRGRDFAASLAFVCAVGVSFAAGRGLVPDLAGPLPAAGLPARLGGSAVLVAGLLLAGASFRARLLAGRGRLATTGPYARLRHPLYAGLALVLVGLVLRQPSLAGALAAAVVVAQYAWLARAEEQELSHTQGEQWAAYAARAGALWPRRQRGGSPTP